MMRLLFLTVRAFIENNFSMKGTMMSNYYEILITMQGKSIDGDDDYIGIGQERKVFSTKGKVIEFLQETYGEAEKQEMYEDNKDPEKIKQVGWIYSFKNCDWSHTPVHSWYQQDWVEVREITSQTVLI
jgi:hypothetical protein